MRSKGFVTLLTGLILFCTSCGTKHMRETFQEWFGDDTPKKLETQRLSLFEYEDKLYGAWAGKMIGVSYGAPYEFKYLGEIMEEDVIRPWQPQYVENALQQDDLYVQMTFLQAIEEKGIQITPQEAATYFAKTLYPLWHANDAGRRNIRAGIPPPDSGHPRYNPHANDIDFQIEADVFGILCPGMPRTAVSMAESFGVMMNYGDGLYGGLFVAGMYSAAFLETDRIAVIEKGLQCIPEKSQYAQLIRDVLEYYRGNPTDWRGCWTMLEEKYGATDLCPAGYNQPLNIDAKLNGGYVVIGLLYGEGDFAKTLEITTRCGQDNDCNPSTAGGVLGALGGYSRIPQEFKLHIPLISDQNFLHTPYNFNTLIQACRRQTNKIIQRYSGYIQRLGDREYYAIPVQKPAAPRDLEQFTASMRDDYLDEWTRLDEIRSQGLQKTLQNELEKAAPGWTIRNCGDAVNPGLFPQLAGRFDVFVTYPKNPEVPCVLTWQGALTEEKPVLHLTAAASSTGSTKNWRLRVYVNGTQLAQETVAQTGNAIQWRDFKYDLSTYAGQTITIELENAADGHDSVAAYWGKIEFVE
ncbi:MAG: ADP-ribosylglycohydrolase family protein [Candidatus Hinthialibacter sp.]